LDGRFKGTLFCFPEGEGNMTIVRRRNTPIAYIFVENEDGSIHIQDGQCQIMTKEKMLDMVYGMMKFIENDITDHDIEEHNDEVHEELMAELAEHYWRKKHPNKIENPTEKSEGWVYFLKADNGLTKIGRTKDLDKRMFHFTVKLPYKLEVIHSIKTDYTIQLEKRLHEKYDSFRVRGEWFALSDEHLEEIKGDY
jgi:hypothetical protein